MNRRLILKKFFFFLKEKKKKAKDGGILTAMVCHFNLRAVSSSLASDQYFISSGRSSA